MADDLGITSFWPTEQGFSYSSLHSIKIEDRNILEKTEAHLNIQNEETIQNDEPQLGLDDVLMLDDIREFSMRHGFSIQAETNFHGDNKLYGMEKSISSPFKESSFSLLDKQSSLFGTSPLKSPEEYLPNSASDTSHSDTFQDLSSFMTQVSSEAVISNASFTASTYSTSRSFSDNSSSQFTNASYVNETLPVTEVPMITEFKTVSTDDSSTDSVITKCTEAKAFKPSRNKDVRKKNNIASQRSRMTRKEREREMENKEKLLEQENQMLRIRIAKLEELTGALKNQLFRSVLGR